MSGFGEKKKENKGSSKKLQKLSEKDLKAKSINNHIKGNLDEAEKGYIAFLKNGYSDADIISNYALICEEKGENEKAIRLYEKCAKSFPNHIYSKLNLSFLYYKLNHLEIAEIIIEEAIKLNPSLPNGHCIKGLILKSLDKYDDSKLSEKDNRELLKNLLNRKDISHRELFGNINSLISKEILEELSILESKLYEKNKFNILIKDKELVKALSLLIFCSPLWEKVLVNIRKNILLNYSDKDKISNSIFNFIIGLGSQCFLNEYVYYISTEEKDKLKKLKKIVNNNKNQEYKLAIISCYQSLSSINDEIINLNTYIPNKKELNNLLNLQFKELNAEKKISKGIKKIGNIKDSTSKEVKKQYELNPYPRWRYNSYAKENKLNFLSVINSEISPNTIKPNSVQLTNKKINILIAGCGTGIQIIEASRYSNCEITAIDLSNSSISYAKRKVDEYGLKNINFIEMDLLELTSLNKRFDLIECSGVLHHMNNPTKGLSNLYDVLKPRGFLKLGLYSKYARGEILKARDLIKEKNIKPDVDGIRSFRNEVLNGEIKQLNEITDWSDFYSTSMCRDLCFHSHENCYSLIEIKEMLKVSNLEFLGFTLSKEIKDKYQIDNKDMDSLKDLELWDKFENSNPNSFREMYQFWARKSIK